MTTHSENYRVNVEGGRDLLPHSPVPAYDFVDKIFDVEAPNREKAAEIALESAREQSDDERFEYRVIRAFKAKPREQQNYSGVDKE